MAVAHIATAWREEWVEDRTEIEDEEAAKKRAKN
jgi:hypothetical protein